MFANTSNFIHLCNELFIPDGKRAVVYATEYYYHVSKEARKIRKLIFSLDKIGDTALADSVMDCAEPPSGIVIHNYMYIIRIAITYI